MRVRLQSKLNAKQIKAINDEAYRQTKEDMTNLAKHFVSIMLWQLHEQEGYGKKKLMRFYDGFVPKIKELQDFYEMHNAKDTEWLCSYKLKELGIDLDKMDDILNIKIVYK